MAASNIEEEVVQLLNEMDKKKILSEKELEFIRESLDKIEQDPTSAIAHIRNIRRSLLALERNL